MANRLISESSPYLRQHAHNPVDWYPWGDDALAKARDEDKPLLLSIGYSACHWCHVMAHESFEDPHTAAIMNERFVNVKVDREERPDLDQIYMTAVQGMTGQGGWPMTVFLTPDGKPFYGGTYFPPTDRGGMPAFQRVLLSVSEAFRSQRSQVGVQADRVAAFIRDQTRVRAASTALDRSVLQGAAQAMLERFDRENGGYAGAPKFPQAMALDFMLRSYTRTHDADQLAMVMTSLRHMAQGGIYDQVGGGFHRYTVDGEWVVPHFEKMLYDNALLAQVYIHAFQLTGDSEARRIAQETLDFVAREMRDASGGFYSTLDADSEGVEGKYYVWSADEFNAVVGSDDADLVREHFGVTREGNFEGKSILTIATPVRELAQRLHRSESDVEAAIARGRGRLFAARSARVRPGLDDKILASWNGLMLRAFAEAARVLGRPSDRAIAEASADFLVRELWRDGHVIRVYKDGGAKIRGYLEDYAATADGLLATYEDSYDPSRFMAAKEITDRMIDLFWDEADGRFYDAASDGETLVARPRDLWDNATPSGTSLACHVLLQLWCLTGDPRYERIARSAMAEIADLLRQHPVGFGNMLAAVDFLLAPPCEIAIIGEVGSPDMQRMLEPFRREYLPNAVLAVRDAREPTATPTIPLLDGRTILNGTSTAYVCRGFVCDAPVTDPDSALEIVRRAG
ncbi:MAG TPA: thioredoxin domain-containing protein [Chloroflexota bacterium]|nr:thioredoxin domain-containing protein [Chloroflexota bacterium]